MVYLRPARNAAIDAQSASTDNQPMALAFAGWSVDRCPGCFGGSGVALSGEDWHEGDPAWTGLMLILLLLEFKSIYQDRNEHQADPPVIRPAKTRKVRTLGWTHWPGSQSPAWFCPRSDSPSPPID
jgi:hypothetical protein